jgi:hypothetical protein
VRVAATEKASLHQDPALLVATIESEASPDGFDVPQGGVGPMRLVLSTKR